MKHLSQIIGEIPDATEMRDRLVKEADAIESLAAREARDYYMVHYLYRAYDADDLLLYIGCTRDVVARMQVHECTWNVEASVGLNRHAARIEVEGPIAGQTEARRREREAIAAEAPLLNIHHNPAARAVS